MTAKFNKYLTDLLPTAAKQPFIVSSPANLQNNDDHTTTLNAQQHDTTNSMHLLRLLDDDEGLLTYIDPMSGTHYAFAKQQQGRPIYLPALSTVLYGVPNTFPKKSTESYFL